MLSGLQAWEIVALAGLLAIGWMSVSATIGVTLAWLIYGERAPVKAPAPATKPAVRPIPTHEPAPEYATA